MQFGNGDDVEFRSMWSLGIYVCFRRYQSRKFGLLNRKLRISTFDNSEKGSVDPRELSLKNWVFNPKIEKINPIANLIYA